MKKKANIEKRTIKTELRVVKQKQEDDALPVIEGYAAVFNSDSEDMMGFIERIRPGAFKEAIKISDVRSLFNHDANIVLGRNKAGTLEIKEDKKGLFMVTHPPDTQLVRDMVMTPIDRGDIDQQSFGFTVEKDSWEGLDTDKPVRTIEKIKELFDVSVVTYPAYQDTSVALRSLAEARNQKPNEDEISIEVNGTEHIFNCQDELDLLVEKINELRKNDASLSTAVLWEKKKASQKTAADNVNESEDESLNRLRKIEKEYNKS
jgi:HK97 family phage prohead protease